MGTAGSVRGRFANTLTYRLMSLFAGSSQYGPWNASSRVSRPRQIMRSALNGSRRRSSVRSARLADHKSPGGPYVDHVEVRQLLGEDTGPKCPMPANVDAAQKHHYSHCSSRAAERQRCNWPRMNTYIKHAPKSEYHPFNSTFVRPKFIGKPT